MSGSDHNFDYLYFARSYLVLAVLGLRELKSKYNTTYDNPVQNWLPVDHTYDRNYLVAPIFFNIKHSIEIFLKNTYLLIENPDKDKTHDLLALFKALRAKVSKMVKSEDLDLLEELVVRYYENDYFKESEKKLDYIAITDEKNDFFRYPNSAAKVVVNFERFFAQFGQLDFETIESDAKKISDVFYRISCQILKVTIDPKDTKNLISTILKQDRIFDE